MQTGIVADAQTLADRLWSAIPDYGSPDGTITISAPLVLEVYQLLRRLAGS